MSFFYLTRRPTNLAVNPFETGALDVVVVVEPLVVVEVVEVVVDPALHVPTFAVVPWTNLVYPVLQPDEAH